MRRSPIVLAATAAGTAGVLAFHAHTPAVPAATTSTTSVTPAATSTATSSGSGSGSGSGSSGSGSSKSSASRTATGTAVDTQYGAAQVQVTIKSGKIVNVQALQLQGRDPKSVQISGSAEPILQQEVLTKQTAGVDAVSGATFTSASYTQSVQSALDKLGFKAADGSRATLQVPQGGH
ncbi:MAG: hypothetical protein QOE28_2537 [Solirubrobacteraceae bacterium]|jgi:uncharacterized protein with FMN-binding domain|nr:hypothetical protein [Solirubrobacteraceae bacterium]